MGMTQLSLLPTTWPPWDWTKSNGSATAEQTQRAYQAITSQGLCSDFSRLVWNDLVDALANALSAAGLMWNTEYGTAESCKISAQYGALTASAFNAVALNIRQFDFLRWKWATDPDIEGYVGRDAFHGVSTHGDNADLLYGWYIIELAEKLNRLLAVLRGAADLPELESPVKAVSYTPANLSDPRAGPLDGTEQGRSFAPASLVARPSQTLAAAETAESKSSATLLTQPSRALETSVHLETKSDALLEDIRSRLLDAAPEIKTYPDVIPLAAARSAAMAYIAESFTKTVTDMNSPKAGNMAFTLESKSHLRADMAGRKVSPLAGTYVEESFTSGELIPAASRLLEAAETSKSHANTAITKGIPLPLEVSVCSKSYSGGEITPGNSEPLSSDEQSTTTAKAEAGKPASEVLATAVMSETTVVCIPEAERWFDPVRTGNNLYIRSADPQRQDGSMVQLGTNLDMKELINHGG